MKTSTRARIVTEALRLFAKRGYAATSVAEIEAAAGLSPGAGGLYRHFPSKEAVLNAAINEHVAQTKEQIRLAMRDVAVDGSLPELAERLAGICRAGLAKMTEEQDLTRVLFRDLDQFPHLVAAVREGLVQPLYEALGSWLAAQPELAGSDHDFSGVAAVLGGSIGNYWLAVQQLGQPPNRVDEPRFVAAWVRVCLGLLTATGTPRPPVEQEAAAAGAAAV